MMIKPCTLLLFPISAATLFAGVRWNGPVPKRGFARTAPTGDFTTAAVREAGEHGGALTPTTEEPSAFTQEGNEAFGVCMTLWNRHEWKAAKDAMEAFAASRPDDPWRGEAELHVACYHKFRGEYAEAERILVPLFERNRNNPVGRKALVRLSHLYYETFRYQAADEVLCQLFSMNPTENEKSFALNWLPHVRQSRLSAANARDCGPRAFAFAAWLTSRLPRVSADVENVVAPPCLPPSSPDSVEAEFTWAAMKPGAEGAGVSLAGMRTLLDGNGWTVAVRRISYAELCAMVSDDFPAVLCIPAPDSPLFSPDAAVRRSVAALRDGDSRLAGKTGDCDAGHYAVLVKATERNAWFYDPENGLVQQDTLALKDHWLRGAAQGLAAFLSPKGKENSHALAGTAVTSEEESAFVGGCCGHAVNNNDTGCPHDGSPDGSVGGCRSCRGMPEHSVNTLNMNYLVTDTPIWSSVPGGPDLDLTLTYNNRESQYARYPVEGVQDSPFGYRWSSAYDASYALDPASNILVRFPNGGDAYFDRLADGTYAPRDTRQERSLGLEVLPDWSVLVTTGHGDARWLFHSLTNAAMQQTLARIENRFGAGTDIMRDEDGRIVRVTSDTTGASLEYAYDVNGNVTGVWERADGSATGRSAAFSYEITNGVSRLASVTDVGGYTTVFEYGQQTYNVYSTNGVGVVSETENVVSDHHVTGYTWPNGGHWSFELVQTGYLNYSQPLRLTVTDPAGAETVYDFYSFSEYGTGPIGKRDRDGNTWFWAVDTIGGAARGNYATLANDRYLAPYVRSGEYLDWVRYTDTGHRRPLLARTFTEPVSGRVGYWMPKTSDEFDMAASARLERAFAYIDHADGSCSVTVTNFVYERATGGIALTDSWTETLELDANEDPVRMTDRSGLEVTLERTNRLVTAISVTPPGESGKTVWRGEYDNRGLLLSRTVDEGLSARISYSYGASGELLSVSYPDGTSENFAYDPVSYSVTSRTDTAGQTVRFVRDAMGRVLTVIFPDGTVSSNRYGCCAAAAVTDRHGVTDLFGYDPVKRLETAVLPSSALSETCLRYGYTGEGHVSSFGYGASFTNLAVRGFGYLATNGVTRLVSRTTPLGKETDTWYHSFAGFPSRHADGHLAVTEYGWDEARGRLLHSSSASFRAGAVSGIRDTLSYDNSSDLLTNVARIVSGTSLWNEAYQYDSRFRPDGTETVISGIPGLAGEFRYSVAYARDERGLVTNRTLSVGNAVYLTSYGYNPDFPRLESVSDPFASVFYAYDSCGRLVSETLRNASGTFATVRTRCYDAYSRLSSLSISNAVSLLRGETYGYDIDRLTSVTVSSGNGNERETRFAYDWQGRLLSADYYTNGISVHLERFRYDAAGNLTDRTSTPLAAPPDLRAGGVSLPPNVDDEVALYRRNAVVTPVGVTASANAVTLPLHPEIAVERLGADGSVWALPFVPVLGGTNALKALTVRVQEPNSLPDYSTVQFSANRAETELLYDGAGNLLNLPGGLELDYDADGNLATVCSNGTVVTACWYDSHGRRIAKREGGVLTLYLWDGMSVIGTADAEGNLRECYTRGIGVAGDVGSLAAETRLGGGGAATVFLHPDWRGDVVLATDTAGNAVAEYGYSAYGEPLAPSAANAYAPRFGFSSKERDASGLVYYGFRYASPELCRWTAPDPIRESGGLNLYAFCGNNPIQQIDTLGLTYWSNIKFLFGWLFCLIDSDRIYANPDGGDVPQDSELGEMMRSRPAWELRYTFATNHCQSIPNFTYQTFKAAIDTVINPYTADWGSTAAQVGGFDGATAINNGDGTVTYTIPNTAGTRSFFYHILSDRTSRHGPMRSVRQTFTWTESLSRRPGGRK
ncbi:MAG: RHS repeat-associated core domain-containing protein [Kiritimatiellae bacterium]|nr:RHS repeat-associated core domain-containing protein [Kiritimatiellia bacterium]